MNASKMTIDQVLNNEQNSYNVTEWTKKVNRFASFKNVQFYLVPKGNGYDYERFFVSYQIPEGINFFASFGYSSSLTNNSFCVVFVRDTAKNEVSIQTSEITVGEKTGRIGNNPHGRKFMVKQTQTLGTIFSNEL
jgi:hypothetical protein